MPSLTELADHYLDAVEAWDAGAVNAILADTVRIQLHPNVFAPAGSVSGKAEALKALEVGRGLLASQRFAERQHVEVDDRVLTRLVWTGELRLDLPGMPAGTRLKADIASLMRFVDGLLVEQENYDCYYAAEVPPSAASL